jgi:hypothetical protein
MSEIESGIPGDLPGNAGKIIEQTCKVCGVTFDELRRYPTRAKVARARRILYLLLFARSRMSESDIAMLVGVRESDVSRMRAWFVSMYERVPQRMAREVNYLFCACSPLGYRYLDIIRDNK